MRVLVLGSSGFIGKRIVAQLRDSGWAEPILAGRSKPKAGTDNLEYRQVDTLDLQSVVAALRDVDAVVNCVAGTGQAISKGAEILVQAAVQTSRPVIVHMSSMAVYGARQGDLDEDSPQDPAAGWYAKAKCEAEQSMRAYAQAGHRLVMLRPGCVHGPGSDMWVGRIAKLLVARRLGDIGSAGDGWSNLIHVDDVAAAVLLALKFKPLEAKAAVFNLAAPDSPRWNQYFVDLAVLLGATPVKTLNPKLLALDSKIGAPIIKLAEILARKLRFHTDSFPVAVPPSLLRLWNQHIHMTVDRAIGDLGLNPRPYQVGLEQSAEWAKVALSARRA